jgi:hypothetical protein
MASDKKAIQARTGIARATTWLILIIWGGWWVLFFLAAAIGSYSEQGFDGLLPRLVVSILIVLTLIMCWRHEIFGGILLIIVVSFSYFYTGLYEPWDNPILRNLQLMTFAAPPLLGALMLILCGITTWRIRKSDDS